MRIKEEDKWKRAFTMHIGSFELTVMFFGMTNSLAMFQAVMNEILRDLINEGKVTAFVNDVLVEEMLRRLEENDLYVKSCQDRLLGSVPIERGLLVSTIVLYLLHLSTCIDSSYIMRRDRK